MDFKSRFKAKFFGIEKEKPKEKSPLATQVEDKYYSYYLFGKSERKPIWNYDIWKQLTPLFQPIIDALPNTPFIKTDQAIPHTYGKNNQFVSYNKGGLRFGRMIWSEPNNKKWTTKYANEKQWKFFSTEIAYPTRNACEKNNINPELLITINNENLLDNDNQQSDQAVTIHINTKLVDENKMLELEKSIKKIGVILHLVIGGKMTRKVTFKENTYSYSSSDSIWDGTYGVLVHETDQFSRNYQKYGIEKWP